MLQLERAKHVADREAARQAALDQAAEEKRALQASSAGYLVRVRAVASLIPLLSLQLELAAARRNESADMQRLHEQHAEQVQELKRKHDLGTAPLMFN